MKFDRKELLDSLQMLKPALGAASTSIQELKHIWFDGDFAFTYNGGLGIRVSLKSGLKFGVPGPPLLGLLSDDTVKEVTLEAKNNTLEVELGKASAKLVTLPLDNSPWNFPLKPAKEAVELELTEELLTALKRVSIIKARPAVRTEHYGVVTFPDKDTVSLYSTDSKALVEVILEVKLPKGLSKLVLPHEFVDVVTRFCEPGTAIYLGTNCFQAQSEKVLICSNVLDSSNLQDIPALVDSILSGKPVYAPLPDTLRLALDRVEVLAGGGDAYVNLETDGVGSLILNGRLTYGDFKEIFKLAKEVKPAKITVDARLLRVGLTEALRFTITKRALVMQGEDGFLFLVTSHEPMHVEQKADKGSTRVRPKAKDDEIPF